MTITSSSLTGPAATAPSMIAEIRPPFVVIRGGAADANAIKPVSSSSPANTGRLADMDCNNNSVLIINSSWLFTSTRCYTKRVALAVVDAGGHCTMLF